jgi:AcrR family transcriptional regulator
MPSPLRSDARRNRELILAAASELFAESGAELSIDELARRAGVGHATIFRRFPSKDDLIVAMIEQRLNALAEAVEEAAHSEDAWEGLAGAMAVIAERQAMDRGLADAADSRVVGAPNLREARQRILTPMADLLARAQAAGQVRADLQPEDVFFLITAAANASPCRFQIPGLWRRYLGVVLDGMRPEGASPLSPDAPALCEIEEAFETVSAESAATSS